MCWLSIAFLFSKNSTSDETVPETIDLHFAQQLSLTLRQIAKINDSNVKPAAAPAADSAV